MIGYIWLAYICGTATTYFIMRSMIKHMRQRNALVLNEADYYYMLMKVAYKSLHHASQEEFDSSAEVRKIKATFESNRERIKRTGKY